MNNALHCNAIKKAEGWATENGLELSPPKTIAVLFTHKTKYTIPSNLLYIGDQPIIPQNTVKYLGVTLDHKLLWTPHIENKITKAKKHLYMLKSSIGTTWGPKQHMMRWLYTAVVCAAFIYGSFVWGKA